MNSFFLGVTGKGLGQQETTKKTIKIYDFESKSDKPVEVDVFTDALGQKLAIAIMKISEEITTKESMYQDGTGKFRDQNEFVKFFDASTGLTVAEKTRGDTSPKFLNEWKDKYTGKTRVKKAKNPGVATGAVDGAPSAPAADTPDPFA